MNMERPQTPNQEDCCGNGCSPCIFEVHKKLVQHWENRRRGSFSNARNILEPLSYKSFYVDRKIDLDAEYCLLCLRYQASDPGEKINLHLGQHVMISTESWTRPFTPISWTNTSFQLLVRIYKNSPFTSKLKSMDEGEEIRVRGPYGDFRYSRNSFRRVIMFGIGSGIAAFYPIVKTIAEDELEDTKVHLVMGFKSIELIPMKQELQLLTDYWNVDCTLQLTSLEGAININGMTVNRGRINHLIVENILKDEKLEETLILVCGNKKFNSMINKCLNLLNFYHYHIFE